MTVCTGLAVQTGAQALEEAKQRVLYLDAPTVSKGSAEKAAEVADAYARPGSPVKDPGVLAWAGVPAAQKPAGPPTAPPPPDAEPAFASITESPATGPGGVSHEQALLAGEALIAQLAGEQPSAAEGGEELASADTGAGVRPRIGDGTKAPVVGSEGTDTPSETDRRQPANEPAFGGEGAPLYASAGEAPGSPVFEAEDAPIEEAPFEGAGPVTAGYEPGTEDSPPAGRAADETSPTVEEPSAEYASISLPPAPDGAGEEDAPPATPASSEEQPEAPSPEWELAQEEAPDAEEAPETDSLDAEGTPPEQAAAPLIVPAASADGEEPVTTPAPSAEPARAEEPGYAQQQARPLDGRPGDEPATAPEAGPPSSPPASEPAEEAAPPEEEYAVVIEAPPAEEHSARGPSVQPTYEQEQEPAYSGKEPPDDEEASLRTPAPEAATPDAAPPAEALGELPEQAASAAGHEDDHEEEAVSPLRPEGPAQGPGDALAEQSERPDGPDHDDDEQATSPGLPEALSPEPEAEEQEVVQETLIDAEEEAQPAANPDAAGPTPEDPEEDSLGVPVEHEQGEKPGEETAPRDPQRGPEEAAAKPEGPATPPEAQEEGPHDPQEEEGEKPAGETVPGVDAETAGRDPGPPPMPRPCGRIARARSRRRSRPTGRTMHGSRSAPGASRGPEGGLSLRGATARTTSPAPRRRSKR